MAKKKADAGSGSIRQRKNGLWEGRYMVGYKDDGGIKSHSIYGKSKREVREKLNAILTEIQTNNYIEPSQTTVKEWLKVWLTEYKINVRHSTWTKYQEHIEQHLNPLIGDVRLDKLTIPQIQKAYNHLLRVRGLSPKSVKNIHGVLHGALEQAKVNGYLRINPSDGVVLPRVEKPILKTMDSQDVTAFLQAIRGDFYEYPLFVSLFTGLREGELLGLTWDCVDFEHGSLLINKQHGRTRYETEFHFSELKTGHSRTLTPANAVMEVLQMQKQRQTDWAEMAGAAWDNPENLVFTNELGRYINNKTLYMNFKRIAKNLGMPTMRLHDLRHTFAVNSLQAGDDIKTVQENLGHTTASFTLATYAHATPGMKRESAKRMDSFIQRVRPAEMQSPEVCAAGNAVAAGA